jgi:hypothetical protein
VNAVIVKGGPTALRHPIPQDADHLDTTSKTPSGTHYGVSNIKFCYVESAPV